MATTLSNLNSLPIADVGTKTENWALMINNLFSYIDTLEAGTAAHPNVVTAALKVTAGAGANKILQSDADGDLTYTLTPNLTSLEIDTLKVTTSAGANKLLVSDADGDLTYTLTPNLTSLEVDTLKVTTSAGANKLLVSDADGDLTYTLTPNLTSLEVDTLKVTTGAGANSVLVSDADGDASWTLTPNLTSLEVDTLKVTTGAAANKLLSSDADGDCAWTATPTLTTLEVGTVKITGGSPGAGKILQSDADGDATWETASGGGGGDFSNGGDAGGAARTLGNTDAYDLGFETTNVTRMTIQAAGRVGIGAGTPTDGTLHVISGTAGTVAADGGADELVLEGTECGMTILSNDDQSSSIFFGSPGGSSRDARIAWNHDGDLFKLGSNKAGGVLQLTSGNGTVGLTIDAASEVGIGTAAPAAPLHVVGTTYFSDDQVNIFDTSASGVVAPAGSGMLHIDIGTTATFSRAITVHSARADAYGQMHAFDQRSASPANNDVVTSFDMRTVGADDTYYVSSGAIKHRTTNIGSLGGDGLVDGYSSDWLFYCCNGVDAAGAYNGAVAPNVYGQLTAAGVWTDSSAGINKLFDDNYTDRYGTICDTLSALRICTYRAANGPEDRPYSFGTSAEEFYEIFGIGEEPRMVTNKDGEGEYRAGIAAKEPAFLALAACQELHARLKALEEE